MSGLRFGFVPTPGTLNLSRYSDFVTELISNTGSWPGGTGIEFHFMAANSSTSTVWAATISGPTATWDVLAADVATLLSSGVSQYRLFYIQGSNTLEWSSGPIVDVS
jgi:hypothetical protein